MAWGDDGHNPSVDQDRRRPEPPAEPPEGGDPEAGDGGLSYTARPSREQPEEGGRTRHEEDEHSDSPEGREQD